MQLRFYANVALKYEMLHYRFTPSSRLKTIIDTFPRVYCKNFGRGWGINWNYRQPFPRLLYCQSKFQITFRRTWIIILRYRRPFHHVNWRVFAKEQSIKATKWFNKCENSNSKLAPGNFKINSRDRSHQTFRPKSDQSQLTFSIGITQIHTKKTPVVNFTDALPPESSV